MAGPSPKPNRKPTVLVVDDELDVVLSLAEALSVAMPEAQVYPAASPKEALDFAARTPVDLVVSDYRMPGMSGEDLLRYLGGTQRPPPAILMTGYPHDGLAYRLRSNGHDATVLTKPFDAAGLARQARRLLERRPDGDLRRPRAVPATPA